MSEREALDALLPPIHTQPRAWDALTAEQQEWIDEQFAAGVSIGRVSTALRLRGVAISYETVRKWKQGVGR